MNPLRKIDLRSLPVQIIVSFIGLVLLTAFAVGVPAIWLISNQLERQVWAQVDQGNRAAQALYTAKQNELINLATLTAQRPTLHELFVQGDPTALAAYLDTLREGAGLDLVLVCNTKAQIVAAAGPDIDASPCLDTEPVGFLSINNTLVWLLAAHPIAVDETQSGWVEVGLHLDDGFAAQMEAQTGLAHTLLVDGQSVATSLTGQQTERVSQTNQPATNPPHTFTSNGSPYYADTFPLVPAWSEVTSPNVLTAEVALDVADIVTAQRGLAWSLFGSIVLVAAAGSLLGVFLARQLSRPLARLTEAATALSENNLEPPVTVRANVREITLVAQALENARVDLQRTLSDLRREKAWADHLLEAIAEGIVTLDHKGRITFFSPGAERITGWQRDEVLHRLCDAVFKPAETDQPFSQFIPPPNQRRKVTLELAGGRQVTLAITGAQLTPPGTDNAQVALVFRDVSAAETVHRIMGHFLANIAHEFRTPLSALAASVELLMDQAPDLSPAELQELLESLHLGILGLQTLVDNLLESASIEAGRFQIKTRPANLGKIVAEAIRMMQPLLDKHGQRLVLELPVDIPTVRADARRTGQVLVNLLSNASKYGPDNAEITITATVEQNYVHVAVTDQGAGVAPRHRDDLFRRFVHLDSAGDKSQYGAGLGLSVVKAIVEAQGGQVGIDDRGKTRNNKNVSFWFTVPVEQEP
jgi:PAS domain S-box-containing protein